MANLKTELLRGLSKLGGIRFAEAALGIGTAIVLARALGSAGLGEYALIMAAVALARLPVELGFPPLATREYAKLTEVKGWTELRGLTVFGLAIMATTSVVVVGLIWGLSSLGDNNYVGLQSAALLVPIVSLNRFMAGQLIGLKKFAAAQSPEAVIRPIIFLLLVAGSLGMGAGIAPETAVRFQVAAALASCATLIGFLLLSLPRDLYGSSVTLKPARWISSTLALGLTQTLRSLTPQGLILILGYVSSQEVVGIFRLAQRGVGAIGFLASAIQILIAPYCSSLLASNGKAQLQRLITRSSQAMTGVALVSLLILTLFGKPLLGVVFGLEFTSAYVPLLILVAAHLTEVCFGPNAMLLNMTGHERATTIGYIILSMTSLSGAAILAVHVGASGAALAYLVSVTAVSLFLWRQSRISLGIRASAFGL